MSPKKIIKRVRYTAGGKKVFLGNSTSSNPGHETGGNASGHNSPIEKVLKAMEEATARVQKAYEETGRVAVETIPLKTMAHNGVRYGLFLQVICGDRGIVQRIIIGKQKGNYMGKSQMPVVNGDLTLWCDFFSLIAKDLNTYEAIVSAVRGGARRVEITGEEGDLL